MQGLIQRNRQQLDRDLRGTDRFWKFSPAVYILFKDLLPELRAHVKGRLLDIGCGTMPFKRFLEGRFEVYDGLDIDRRSPETKFICDAQDMKPVSDADYDTVLSVASLEHMPYPWKGFSEMVRVTKPAGCILILVPHLSRYHEEPIDFYRFTGYGLEALGRLHGMEIIKIKPIGGLFAFLGHQISTILLGIGWHLPVIRWILFWINYVFIVRGAIFFDRILGTQKLFPMDILAVYRKSGEAAAAERPA